MEKVSAKQALLDLLHVDVHLPKVGFDYPELKPITDFICEGNFLDEEDLPWPTIKDISQATTISYDKVRRYILKLYDLMFPFMEHKYLSFSKVKYELYFSYFDYKHYMLINKFPVPLRVGENLTMPFLKAKLQTDRFYITSIRHYFERDVQKIEVKLMGGDYNLFWHYRLDEALEKREIAPFAVYDKEDYVLKEEVIRGRI